MGTVYTSTIKVHCWKTHTCLSCSCVYSYEFLRDVKGSSGTIEAASAKAREKAVRVVEREVDVEACPTCGLVQPDMVGQQRARAHLWTFLAALALGFAVLLGRESGSLQSDTATLGLVFFCAVAAAVVIFVQIRNPNSDLSRNLELARKRARSGRIRVHVSGEPGAVADELARPRRSILQTVSFALLLAAIPCVVSPELLRAQHAWPLNEACEPGVVGPGDRTRVHLDRAFRSINGLWRGKPDVNLQIEGSPSLRVAASTNARSWGSNISAKAENTNTSVTPSINITLGEDESLAGKSAQLDINLDVEYPSRQGPSTFTTQQTHLHQVVPLRIASALNAGVTYESWWWNGTLLGGALTLLGAFSLFCSSRVLQRKARPTRVYTGPDLP